MTAIAFGQDGSFSWEDLSARYQAELANGFGNLASRATAMIERYFEGIVPAPSTYMEGDLAIQRAVADAATAADAAIERFRIDEAITAIWTIVDALNGYITDNEPWVLAKDDAQRERLGTVLYTAAEGLRALAVLLSPVMPVATEKLWIALGAAETLGRLQDQPIREAGAWGILTSGTSVNGLAPLFPRVEQSV
ncbi:MAG: class I tRNA ligase family protein, partial [Microbacterium sp.]|nr:class I tRNA ligase family protein [Microbacterium sp.]